MHSSLHISSLHSKKVVGGLDSVSVCRLGRDTAVDLAVLHSFRPGEQMLMVRLLVAMLGHLVGLQILGETRLPVEQVEILVLVVGGKTSSTTSASWCASASLALLKPLGLKSLVALSRITCTERHCIQLRNDLM
jgi:hypothetical protein